MQNPFMTNSSLEWIFKCQLIYIFFNLIFKTYKLVLLANIIGLNFIDFLFLSILPENIYV